LESAAQANDAQAENWEILGKVYGVLGMANEAQNAFDKADQLRK
jgi:cytochrome c-type biogenesis protein CcmH/NrfG